MQRYAGKTFVIKYGGHAMVDDELARVFARDIVLLKQVGINPIVVHGGGPQIAEMLERLQIKSSFVDGLRVTDAATVEVVEMVLAGKINKQIVSAISQAGGNALGLSGKDAGLMLAKPRADDRRTARPSISASSAIRWTVDAEVLQPLASGRLHPGDRADRLWPRRRDLQRQCRYRGRRHRRRRRGDAPADADRRARRARQGRQSADRPDRQPGRPALMKDGTISGGMIPKLETCLDALKGGVEAAVILDGRVPHALLLEIFTAHGVGTLVRRD